MAEREGSDQGRHFRPEFLNRVDDVIVFKPLGRGELKTIVDLQLRRLEQLLADRKMSLRITGAAKEGGYDPAYGARPLKRAIQRLVQNPLAVRILEGEFDEGDTVVVDRDASGNSSSTRPAARPRSRSRRGKPPGCSARSRSRQRQSRLTPRAGERLSPS